MAAPFALVFLAGVVLAEPPTVTARLTLDAERVIETDVVEGTLTLTMAPPAGPGRGAGAARPAR